MIQQSTITCPKCGHQTVEQMPTDACRFFYDCKGCGERLKPRPGASFPRALAEGVMRAQGLR
jgi:transcription elongation factor Elf1